MPTRTPRIPSYRLHKPTGQAVVTIDGRDHYLGRHDTPESRAEYDRRVAEWLAGGRASRSEGSDLGAVPSGPTVSELILAYLRFADSYYLKAGEPTGEPESIRQSVRPLRRLYGHTDASGFGPLALKSCRQAMIDANLCRGECNKRTRRIVRLFGWAVENELVPPTVHYALKAVKGLAKGRTDAREAKPVRPVPDAFVEMIRPHVSRQVWAMIELQRLTGMRPGEVCIMRTGDLDVSGRVWAYTPERHKTEHHGKRRTVYLGPKAQAILRPWLRTNVGEYLFSACEAERERKAAMRAARKSKVQPSQVDRSRPGATKTPRDRYDTRSYHHAIRRGCLKAGIAPWHPNQLRHNAATRLRRDFGLDATRAILGHSTPVVTEVYAELDAEKAVAAMERVG